MKSAVDLSRKLVVIVGPTASGKTALSLKIAQKYGGEIVCADSRTLYRDFDIGTAKPTAEEQLIAPHHMIDICNPGEKFSAARFKELAEEQLLDIRARRRLPIIVGGTGLYVDALLFDYQFERTGSLDRTDYAKLTTAELAAHVQRKYGAQVTLTELKNRQRLLTILQHGRVASDDRKKIKKEGIIVGLNVQMPVLKQKITMRIENMLNTGFIQEAETLIDRYGVDCPQFEIIGYRHAREYINKKITIEELIARFSHDDYQLARRQMTWFRRNPHIVWCDSSKEALRAVEQYLSR